MTYRDLLLNLQKLTDEQLDSTITVQDVIEDEYYPACFGICEKDNGVLDDEHPVIFFNMSEVQQEKK